METDVLTVEERYTSAAHSGNLRVQSEHGCDADVMIAAGWSGARIGLALLRLRSEYDGIQHPRKTHKPRPKWSHNELALMLLCLKSLPSVRTQLTINAEKFGIKNPDDVAASVLWWWLDQTCPVCHGQKREVIENTPILSDIICPACRGVGERSIPYGDAGRKIATFIDGCIYSAKQRISDRLHYR